MVVAIVPLELYRVSLNSLPVFAICLSLVPRQRLVRASPVTLLVAKSPRPI
jgi:hypothetical protein